MQPGSARLALQPQLSPTKMVTHYADAHAIAPQDSASMSKPSNCATDAECGTGLCIDKVCHQSCQGETGFGRHAVVNRECPAVQMCATFVPFQKQPTLGDALGLKPPSQEASQDLDSFAMPTIKGKYCVNAENCCCAVATDTLISSGCDDIYCTQVIRDGCAGY